VTNVDGGRGQTRRE
jgi:hypothetical protein